MGAIISIAINQVYSSKNPGRTRRLHNSYRQLVKTHLRHFEIHNNENLQRLESLLATVVPDEEAPNEESPEDIEHTPPLVELPPPKRRRGANEQCAQEGFILEGGSRRRPD